MTAKTLFLTTPTETQFWQQVYIAAVSAGRQQPFGFDDEKIACRLADKAILDLRERGGGD